MKCPICGCKMKEEFMCPYCKITGDQVKEASNAKAKECLKSKNAKDVYISTYLPKDVNNTRLMLITIFGGIFGINYFYVGRNKMGFLFLYAIVQSLLLYILTNFVFASNVVLNMVADVSYLIEAIFVILWMSDIVKVVMKKFPIPVVLGENNRSKK